jgi:hypothetical protein
MTTATDVKTGTLLKIEALLKSVNGKRRERKLSRAEVVELIRDVVIDGQSFSFTHGGSVANAYQQSAMTTLAIVSKVEDRFFLGINTASAKRNPTPGRAFATLQPFGEQGPRGNAAGKWLAWTASSNVIELTGPEIDSLIETGEIEE